MAQTRSDRRPEEPVLRTLVIGSGAVRLLGGEDELCQKVPGMDHALETRLWELRRTRQRSDPNLHRVLLETGAAMSERFLVGEVAEALARDVEDAEGWGVPLELGIRVEDPVHTSLPWETLRVQGPDGILGPPLSLHPNVHLYRSVKSPGPVTDIDIPGPLRILVAIGSPEEQNESGELLDYEAELERIHDSVREARREGKAHVHILQWGTVKAIRDALEERRYHVLYISCHAGPGVLVLEDENGAKDLVSAARLVRHLPEGRRPPLVFLAGCATAQGRWGVEMSQPSEPETDGKNGDEGPPKFSYLPGLAESLLRRGVPTVVAMQATVGDAYARRLGAKFFGSLAISESKGPLRALTFGRRELEEERAKDPERGPDPEWATPALYLLEAGPSAGASRRLYNPETWKEIEKAKEPTFAEGVVHRREGFVGRRRETRTAWKVLRDGKRPGVLIHGLGGVGKSTWAAELAARSREGRVLVSVYGKTSAEQVLDAVGSTLLKFALANGYSENHPLRGLSTFLRSSNEELKTRFEVLVENVLAQLPLLLLVDNFEDNLTEDHEVQDPDLANLLAKWLKRPGQSRVLVTSRYPFALPDSAEERLERFHLGPLSLAETRKLFWRLPQLDALEPEQQEQAYAVVGGHPRTLEYLDALLAGGEARFLDVEEKLRKTLSEAGKQPEAWLAQTRGNLDQALAEVVTLAVQDVVLEDLLARLDNHPLARKLLFRASVYRLPVDSVGLAWQVGKEVEVEEDPEREERRKNLNERTREARKEGKELTAENLGYSEQEWQQLEEDERHRLTPPLEDVPDDLGKAVDQLLELGLLAPGGEHRVIVHRWTADALDRLDEAGEVAEGHQRAARYWRWRVKVWPQDRLEDVQQLLEARWHHRVAGETDEAIEVTWAVVSQLDTWGAYRWEAQLCREVLEWVPESSAKAAGFLHQLGNIAYRQGSYDEALAWYRKSLEIAEGLGNRSGMASLYHQLGMVAQLRGSYDEALSWHRKSLKMREDLEDRSGIASSYHHLGMIAEERASYDEAEDLYLKSLKIKKELGNELGIASSYSQLGVIAHKRGRHDDAYSWGLRSLRIREELGDRWGIANSCHLLGLAAHKRGSFDEALFWYRRSLEISEELGDRLGIAHCYGQMGSLAKLKTSYHEALGWYRKSLAILEEVGNLSSIAIAHHQLGGISEECGLYDQALSWYRRSLEASKKLGNRSGMAASLHHLGIISVKTGRVEEGVPWQLQSLSLLRQIGFSLSSHEMSGVLLWLVREEDLLGEDRFREILNEQLDPENRDNVLAMMQQFRQAQQEAEEEAGGLEGSA